MSFCPRNFDIETGRPSPSEGRTISGKGRLVFNSMVTRSAAPAELVLLHEGKPKRSVARKAQEKQSFIFFAQSEYFSVPS
jgi:hypothetical protein